MLLGALSALALAQPVAAKAIEPPLVVYAAGSTTGVLGAMLDDYTSVTGQQVTLRTGPAGLMRERIEAGDKVDLFVSANMAHPQRLRDAGRAEDVALFARNRLCVTALPPVGLTRANLLDRLLDPAVRIGTSTPGADPGGDYAQAFFVNADRLRPGATAILKAKARAVVGGKIEDAKPAASENAATAMARRGIDVSVGYCSSRATTPDRSIIKIPVPQKLTVDVRCGMAVVTTSHDAAREAAARGLASYLRSATAQRLLPRYGFVRP